MAIDPVRPEQVIHTALDAGIELFLSLVNIPTALLPHDDPDEDPDEAPVYSEKTQEWLSLTHFQKEQIVPLPPTLRAAQVTLAGMARERGIKVVQEREAEELISRDPAAAATFRLLREGAIAKFGKPLYERLTKTAEDMRVKDGGWPGAAHILGRRLKKLKALFGREGVLITWSHTNEGTFWEIRGFPE